MAMIESILAIYITIITLTQVHDCSDFEIVRSIDSNDNVKEGFNVKTWVTATTYILKPSSQLECYWREESKCRNASVDNETDKIFYFYGRYDLGYSGLYALKNMPGKLNDASGWFMSKTKYFSLKENLKNKDAKSWSLNKVRPILKSNKSKSLIYRISSEDFNTPAFFTHLWEKSQNPGLSKSLSGHFNYWLQHYNALVTLKGEKGELTKTMKGSYEIRENSTGFSLLNLTQEVILFQGCEENLTVFTGYDYFIELKPLDTQKVFQGVSILKLKQKLEKTSPNAINVPIERLLPVKEGSIIDKIFSNKDSKTLVFFIYSPDDGFKKIILEHFGSNEGKLDNQTLYRVNLTDYPELKNNLPKKCQEIENCLVTRKFDQAISLSTFTAEKMRLPESQINGKPQPKDVDKRNLIYIIVGCIGAFLVAVAGISAILLWRYKNKDSSRSECQTYLI